MAAASPRAEQVRSKLIAHGEYTDLVDDVILKMAMGR